MGQIINSPLNLKVGQSAPDGIPPNIKPFLDPLYLALQNVQQAFIQYAGIAPADPSFWSQLTPDLSILIQNMNRVYVKASETIAYGAMVHFLDDGVSYVTARNANATNNTRPARAFCNTVGGVAINAYGEFISLNGLTGAIGGLTRGSSYFLSTTNGLITAVAPVAAGNIEQFLGFAYTSSLLHFKTGHWIQH